MVTEQVGIAQPQLELVQSGGAHVCGEEVVQSRRHGYTLIDVCPLQDGSERERRDRRHICRGRISTYSPTPSPLSLLRAQVLAIRVSAVVIESVVDKEKS